MIAGIRIGVHSYTYSTGTPAHLLIDLRSSLYNYPGKTLWSGVHLWTDGTVTGFRETHGWAPGRQLYFAMHFSAPLTDHGFFDRETAMPYKGFQGPGRRSDAVAEKLGRALEARLDFGILRAPLEVKVALSGVDETAAVANLASEPGDFDAVHARTAADWTQALGAVEIDAPAPLRTSVYTALYHALLAFRAEHPLLTPIQPERTTDDVVRSLVASREASPYGTLPVCSSPAARRGR